tara:strand:+ start:2213 stop:2353 length:141 start_codon:yes stop_codon:yes gene_type:complete
MLGWIGGAGVIAGILGTIYFLYECFTESVEAFISLTLFLILILILI